MFKHKVLMLVLFVIWVSPLYAMDSYYRVYETKVQNLDKRELYNALFYEADGKDNMDPDFIIVTSKDNKVYDKIPVGPNFDVCSLGSYMGNHYAIHNPDKMKFLQKVTVETNNPKSFFMALTPATGFAGFGTYANNPIYVPYAIIARNKVNKQNVLYGTILVLWKEELGQGVVAGGMLTSGYGPNITDNYGIAKPTNFRGKPGESIIVTKHDMLNINHEYILEKVVPMVEKEDIPSYMINAHQVFEKHVRGIAFEMCGYSD